MPDNGLYNSATDTYNGDGLSSYNFSYIPVQMAMEAVLRYPWYNGPLLVTTYSATLEYPNYIRSINIPEGT